MPEIRDGLDRHFRLGRNLNRRDIIAARKMAGGYLKLLYPDGISAKEEVENRDKDKWSGGADICLAALFWIQIRSGL